MVIQDEYIPISDETLFGVPVDEQPQQEMGRNFFDENQAILGDALDEDEAEEEEEFEI